MTVILTRRDVARLLTLDECIGAVEAAFRMHGEKRIAPPGILATHVDGGGFHIKTAVLPLSRNYFGAKVNGNFPGNAARFGLPTIQGMMFLADATNGEPLAIMDSIEITILRTGAATAVAAKHLARPESRVVTVCGCGNQGRVQVRALSRVLKLSKVFAWDIEAARARGMADELSAELGIEVAVAEDLSRAASESDVCVTCTPSHAPFLMRDQIRPGTFVAAVGADSPDKQELDPRILSASTVVADVLDQCATIGELHHAIASSAMARDGVHAELGEVVAGSKRGRRSQDEITVFDSTGAALQDVAAAAVVYEKALQQGIGLA
jgi:alanine dehydrogenase